MKIKEKTTMRNMTMPELGKLMDETRKKLASIVLNRYSKQSKNVREVKSLRQKIAVAKTFIHEMELHNEK